MDYKEKIIALLNSKELSQEQKEKLEFIFPELKESEDKQHRKWIIEYLYYGLRKADEQFKPQFAAAIDWLEKQGEPKDKGEISDGCHTFNELYRYRMLYNAAFFNMLPKEIVHKSKRHHDGKECFGGGWFIVMANLPTGQISNHYELKDWDLFQIPEKEIADEWDGHTPQEAAERLHKYLLEKQGEQPTDKVEPKFKIGDWVMFNGTVAQILNKQKYGFVGLDIDGKDFFCNYGHTDSMRLWTINDAKDGDLIYVSKEVECIQAIFHKFENGIIYFHCNLCGDFMQGGYEPSGDVEFVNPLPKIHYQRFFQKMKEAGYKWDGEKKELRKIDAYQFLSEPSPCSNCTNSKGCITCVDGDQKSTSTPKRILYSDEVIEWFVANIRDYEYFVEWFKKDFGL